MTLNDFCSERENVIVWVAGIGCPTGDYHVADCPDMDELDRWGCLDLEGEIDGAGDWRWNGEGKPSDDRANSITKIHAYVDANRYASVVEEYETA